MARWIAAALGLVMSVTVGAGLGVAHEWGAPQKPATESVTDDAADSFDAESQTGGDDVEIEGTLEVLVEDRADGERYRYVLSTLDGKRWPLQGLDRGGDLLTGDRVRIRGRRFEKVIRLEQSPGVHSAGAAFGSTGSGSAGLQVLAQASSSGTFGPQRTVVLLVNFSNDHSQPTTIAGMRTVMAASDEFFRENSYQQTSLVVDVFGWYTLPMTNATCSTASIKAYADQAAAAAGVALGPYSRRVYAFPYTSACPWAGSSTVGGNPSSAWINGQVDNFLGINHELGHGFGLYHSHALRCPPGILGPSCSPVEYGDLADTMGSTYGHFNAFQKGRLGWLDYGISPPITTVGTSGAYTIDAYELPGSGPKALRIPRAGSGQSFFVELRQSVGFDVYVQRPGLFVHLVTDSNPHSSYLLDMTPETISFSDDAVLDVGKTFTDPVSGVSITALSVGGAGARVAVNMASSCSRSAPAVSASPGRSADVQAGTTVSYEVSVTNTDSAGCSASSFALEATAPAGWQKSFDAAILTVNPGATVSSTLHVRSPAVPPASYTITIVAAAIASVGSLSGSVPVVYAVVSGASPGGGAFTDPFDRPDSAALGNGWVPVTGRLKIEAGQARNEPNAPLSLAVQPGFIGATQTVAASFASAGNNSAPRFGIVVRYRDPQNYYICYRQVGGSSAARIAKVQNGVETVLRSVPLANPAPKVFRTLSCQASGGTLTLQVNGVSKVSATDGTFSTGSVGYAISTQSATSHRVDNFSAIVQ